MHIHKYVRTHTIFFWYSRSRFDFTNFSFYSLSFSRAIKWIWWTLACLRAYARIVRFIWSVVESKCFFYFKSWICYALLSACVLCTMMYVVRWCVFYFYMCVRCVYVVLWKFSSIFRLSQIFIPSYIEYSDTTTYTYSQTMKVFTIHMCRQNIYTEVKENNNNER